MWSQIRNCKAGLGVIGCPTAIYVFGSGLMIFGEHPFEFFFF